MGWTGLSRAAASRLLEKLLHQSIIVSVVGRGKGAYKPKPGLPQIGMDMI